MTHFYKFDDEIDADKRMVASKKNFFL